MTCVFCSKAGVHECAGGRIESRVPKESSFALGLGQGFSVYPGLIDGDHYNVERYELLHAYAPALLDEWRAREVHRARRQMP
jgi:hypothetical protein